MEGIIIMFKRFNAIFIGFFISVFFLLCNHDPTGPSKGGTLTDIDCNIYQIVKIGDQWWMAENLKVTHYLNGDHIPYEDHTGYWSILKTGAYSEYDNDPLNVDTYGRLYNWYAVNDSRKLAPEGWHIATDDDWKKLEMYLGMSQSEADKENWRGTNEGSKLKSKNGWSENGNGTDEYDFFALPGGYRSLSHEYFYYIGGSAYFWSSTEYNYAYAWYRLLNYSSTKVSRHKYRSKLDGLSVRCVKD